MNVTNNLKLPQYTGEDIFDLQDINKAYDSIDKAYGNLDDTYRKVANIKNEITKTNATAEVIDARGGKETLGKRLDEFGSQMDTKASKNEIFTMANMGQDIKEAMTGGSVAVVGKNSVLNENIVNNQITLEKLKNRIFGNCYRYDGVKQYNQLFLTFSTFNNIKKLTVKCDLFFDKYIDNENPNARLIIEGYEDFNIDTGVAWSYTNKYTAPVTNFMNGYTEFEVVIDIDNKKINGISFKVDSGNVNATAKYYVKNLCIYGDGELITNIDCPLKEYNKNGAELHSEFNFIASQKFVEDKIKNIFNDYDSTTKSSLTDVVCWGDSITEGGSPGLPYPSVLQTLLGDKVVVTNRGSSGQCSGNIAFRQGGKQIFVNSDFTIPNNNTQYVNFALRNEDYQNMRTDSPMECIINGVKGEIIITYTNSVYGVKFKRETTGDSVNVSVGAEIKSTQAIHSDDLSIIWIGRNDIAFSYPHQIDGVINNVKNIVNNLSPKIKRFLVISVTTATSEMPDEGNFTTQHGWVTEINKQLKELYPNNFVNMLDYLVNDCIFEMGLTPTETDLNCIAHKTIPPQLMNDEVHPNEQTKVYIAKKIHKELKLRNWVIN